MLNKNAQYEASIILSDVKRFCDKYGVKYCNLFIDYEGQSFYGSSDRNMLEDLIFDIYKEGEVDADE
jgi:hypothetical protein